MLTRPESHRAWHAETIEFDFMEPAGAVRRRLDERSELGFDRVGGGDGRPAPILLVVVVEAIGF
jgi:hypothetical protein